MKYSENLHLALPEGGDPLEVSKLGENFEALDEAIEQKTKESGFQVGDLLQTTRAALSEKWALCNGDILDPAQYPEYAQIATDPITMFEHLSPTIDLTDYNIRGEANGCVVDDKYVTYLKYYTSVPTVSSVWIDCEAMTVEQFDFTASSNEGLNISRAFTVYNPVEKKVYYYNGTNVYKSGIKGALSLVGSLQLTWPTANSAAIRRVAYRNGKYSAYFSQSGYYGPLIIQSASPTFSTSVSIGISNLATGSNQKVAGGHYFLGKPGEVILCSVGYTSNNANGIVYITEDANGGFSQKTIPIANLPRVTSIEVNQNSYTPTSGAYVALRSIKYLDGKYYLVYVSQATYMPSSGSSSYFLKKTAFLVSANSLESSTFTELYSVSWIQNHSSTNTDILNTERHVQYFAVTPVKLRGELYFLPECNVKYSGAGQTLYAGVPVLKMSGNKAIVVRDTLYGVNETLDEAINYLTEGTGQWLLWNNVKSVAFKPLVMANLGTTSGTSGGVSKLIVVPSLRVPLIPDDDIVRTAVKVK